MEPNGCTYHIHSEPQGRFRLANSKPGHDAKLAGDIDCRTAVYCKCVQANEAISIDIGMGLGCSD